MATAGTVQERTKAVMAKAEETIKELEETVQSIPEKGSSPWLLGAAMGSIVGAVALYARGKKDDAMFVGLWAPTFLALSLFKDLLKVPKKG